jgi:hypothetical protein
MDLEIVDEETRRAKIREWKEEKQQFSEMVNSTSVVNGVLSNVKIHEKDLTELVGLGNIVEIKSNYHYWCSPDYKVKKPKPRKVNKKTIKKKPRTIQGNGKSFNSQITFAMMSKHIRDNPNITYNGKVIKLRNDAHAKTAKTLVAGDDGYDPNKNYELVEKVYKVKLFRNGQISIPGVLTEDFSDIRTSLEELCVYLSKVLKTDVQIESMSTTTRNFKFMTMYGSLDLVKFQHYCNNHLTTLLNTRWENIESFVYSPVLMEKSVAHTTAPQLNGDYLGIYNKYLSEKYNAKKFTDEIRFAKLPDMVPNMGEFYSHCTNVDGVKNLYINFADMCNKMLHSDMIAIHAEVSKKITNIEKEYFITLQPQTKYVMRRIALQSTIVALKKALRKSKNNIISNINYNPEIYAGFILRIKSPIPDDPTKQTTIKLFSSGKINLDGANTRSDAEYIYYWLNSVFNRNPQFLYNEAIDPDDDDYSFSE